MNRADKLRLRLELVEGRGYDCERCGEPGSQLHHGIIGNKKRFKKELFCKENLFVSCATCNVSRVMDNEKWRQRFWRIQCDRYGEFHMLEWLGNLPFKIPPFNPETRL